MLRRPSRFAAAAFSLAAAAAQAHTGHDTGSLYAGLVHPLGLDHLLAMVVVGVWSVLALPAGRRWAGPLLFMGGLTAGAAAGAAGWALPPSEPALALSVVVFAALLAWPQAIPAAAGLALTALAAALHGLAHGAELPAGASFAGYAAGFLLTTALLHAGGLGLGRLLAPLHRAAVQLLASGMGLAGLALLARA